jgi:predicted AlkP superfamily phosphohydrolase/phosphomutase/tetratricopeptide (TPR) repeat protein
MIDSSDRVAKKVLLIGWDAADWQIIHPLLDAGLLPNLSRFVEGGVIGNLATLAPVLSPILWNSIATGQRGDKHGILGFTEIDESTATLRPVQSTSRRVKALWNILSQNGLKAHVLGWYASHPAEPLPGGAAVSSLFAHAVGAVDQPWPLPPGTVHPSRLAETLAALRIHPAEFDEQALLPFIPRAFEVDQKTDRRIAVLAKLLAECVSIHMAATYLLESEEWDFLAVYYDAVDHFCHGFMPYHPPAQAGIDEKDAAIYGGVVRGCYRFHDMLLGALVRLAGPDCTVLIVSDHGFYNDHQRPRGTPKHPSGPTISHRPYGILALNGPGIRRDERVYGAGLLDIAPTVLALFGLPAGEDMPGRVWREAVADPDWQPPIRIPSWDDVPGDAGLHSPEDRAPRDAEAERAALEQLIELGYMERPGEDKQKALQENRWDRMANLAHVYLGSNRPELALPLLETIAREWTEQPRYILELAQCCFRLGQNDRARGLLNELKDRPEFASSADLLQGEIAFGSGDTAEALRCLRRAAAAAEGSRLPAQHLQIGDACLKERQWADARGAFEQALVIDADCAQAHHGLAIVALRERRFADAAEHALRSVGLMHYRATAHLHLGVALTRLGRFERAVQAFRTCLSMQPGTIAAHRWLALIYRRNDKAVADGALAAQHQLWAGQLLARRREQQRKTGVSTLIPL